MTTLAARDLQNRKTLKRRRFNEDVKFYYIFKPRRGGYQIAAPGNWVTPSVCLSVRLSEANRLPNYKCSMAKLGIL